MKQVNSSNSGTVSLAPYKKVSNISLGISLVGWASFSVLNQFFSKKSSFIQTISMSFQATTVLFSALSVYLDKYFLGPDLEIKKQKLTYPQILGRVALIFAIFQQTQHLWGVSLGRKFSPILAATGSYLLQRKKVVVKESIGEWSKRQKRNYFLCSGSGLPLYLYKASKNKKAIINEGVNKFFENLDPATVNKEKLINLSYSMIEDEKNLKTTIESKSLNAIFSDKKQNKAGGSLSLAMYVSCHWEEAKKQASWAFYNQDDENRLKQTNLLILKSLGDYVIEQKLALKKQDILSKLKQAGSYISTLQQRKDYFFIKFKEISEKSVRDFFNQEKTLKFNNLNLNLDRFADYELKITNFDKIFSIGKVSGLQGILGWKLLELINQVNLTEVNKATELQKETKGADSAWVSKELTFLKDYLQSIKSSTKKALVYHSVHHFFRKVGYSRMWDLLLNKSKLTKGKEISVPSNKKALFNSIKIEGKLQYNKLQEAEIINALYRFFKEKRGLLKLYNEINKVSISTTTKVRERTIKTLWGASLFLIMLSFAENMLHLIPGGEKYTLRSRGITLLKSTSLFSFAGLLPFLSSERNRQVKERKGEAVDWIQLKAERLFTKNYKKGVDKKQDISAIHPPYFYERKSLKEKIEENLFFRNVISEFKIKDIKFPVVKKRGLLPLLKNLNTAQKIAVFAFVVGFGIHLIKYYEYFTGKRVAYIDLSSFDEDFNFKLLSVIVGSLFNMRTPNVRQVGKIHIFECIKLNHKKSVVCPKQELSQLKKEAYLSYFMLSFNSTTVDSKIKKTSSKSSLNMKNVKQQFDKLPDTRELLANGRGAFLEKKENQDLALFIAENWENCKTTWCDITTFKKDEEKHLLNLHILKQLGDYIRKV